MKKVVILICLLLTITVGSISAGEESYIAFTMDSHVVIFKDTAINLNTVLAMHYSNKTKALVIDFIGYRDYMIRCSYEEYQTFLKVISNFKK